MSLSVGIVGLANVGKSTLFEALTKKQVNISNYPFCTIEPNVGIVEVPDIRVDKLAVAFNSAKKIPTIVKFVDIAGLVRGANKGEGLGNQFLANIRETDAILFVVRCFENQEITHVEKTIDPVRDIDIVNTELLLKDLETVDKRMQKPARIATQSVAGGAEEKDKKFLRELKDWLEQGNLARQFSERNEFLKELQLLTDKPSIFVLNSNTPAVPPAVVKKMKELNSEYIVANLRDEFDASKLTEEEKKELELGESKLGEIVAKSYKALGLLTFFTTGPDETRAWTIKQGTLAPQAAGGIHSDFEKKFICALVINWEKLLNKELPETKGRDYAVLDGDVIEVKHG